MLNYSKTDMKRLFLYTILSIFNLSLLVFTILTTSIIHAQADYMGPGVPFSAKCYMASQTKITLNIEAPKEMTVNTTKKIPISLINVGKESITVTGLKLTFNFTPETLKIENILIPSTVCGQKPEATINNQTGTLVITLDNKTCNNITLKPNQKTKIADIYVKGNSTGTGTLILTSSIKNPQTFVTTNTQGIISSFTNTNTTYEIKIKALSQGTTPTPEIFTPTTNPSASEINTGITDEYILPIVIGLLILGFIIKTIEIKSNSIIEYVEE